MNKNRFPLRLTSNIFRLHNSDVKNQGSLRECIAQVLKATPQFYCVIKVAQSVPAYIW